MNHSESLKGALRPFRRNLTADGGYPYPSTDVTTIFSHAYVAAINDLAAQTQGEASNILGHVQPTSHYPDRFTITRDRQAHIFIDVKPHHPRHNLLKNWNKALENLNATASISEHLPGAPDGATRLQITFNERGDNVFDTHIMAVNSLEMLAEGMKMQAEVAKHSQLPARIQKGADDDTLNKFTAAIDKLRAQRPATQRG